MKKVILLAVSIILLQFSEPTLVNQAVAACADGPEQGVNWEGCRKSNLMLSGVNLNDANLQRTNIISTDMRGSKFDNADFRKAALVRVAFDGSSAKGANFEKAHAFRVSFKNTNLEKANFRKSEMQRVNFSNSNLLGVNFSESEAGRARFDDATMGDNDFSFANVARADFRKAKLTGPINFEGAYLYRTRFEGVDLTNITGFKQWQFDVSCGDDMTKLPVGITKPQSWPCSSE